MIKAAHIFKDRIFLDAGIASFETVGIVEHHYFCLKNPDVPFAEIKNSKKIVTVKNTDEIITLVNEGEFEIIFLHSLCISPKVVLSFKPDIKLVWITWGGDIYSNASKKIVPCRKLIRIPLYEPHIKFQKIPQVRQKSKGTKPIKASSLIVKPNSILFKIWKSGFVQNSFLARYIPFAWEYYINIGYKRFVRRVDYISTVLPIEYEIICKTNLWFKKKYFYFSYLDKETLTYDVPLNAKDILVGNSLSPVNDHVNILEILKKSNVYDRNWVMPLSYSHKDNYRFYLQEYINNEKNACIKPMWEFFPKEKYFRIISSCQYAVYGTKGQAAMGNIFQTFSTGQKLFLFKDSIVYKYLTDCGFIVFSIEDDLNNKGLNTPLTVEQIQHNRQLISELMDYDKHIQKLAASIKEVLSDI